MTGLSALNGSFGAAAGDLPGAVIASFDFRREFDASRLNGFRSGVILDGYEEEHQHGLESPEEKRREIIAFAELMGNSFSLGDIGSFILKLCNGREMTVRQMKRAVENIRQDVDGAIDRAQAAGILPKNMSQTERDTFVRNLERTDEALEQLEQTGEVPPALTTVPPDVADVLVIEAASEGPAPVPDLLVISSASGTTAVVIPSSPRPQMA